MILAATRQYDVTHWFLNYFNETSALDKTKQKTI